MLHKAAVNRVVVTGLGAITSVGLNLNDTWSNVTNGYSGIRKYEFEKYPAIPCKIAARVPREDDPQSFGNNDPKNNNNPPNLQIFESSNFLKKSETYYSSPYIQYALAAAQEAMTQSGLEEYLNKDKENKNEADRYRMAVSVASGIGGLQSLENDLDTLNNIKYSKISPYSIPNMLVNSAAGAISLRFGLNGPNLAQATACAASSHAIQEGFFMIATGIADVAVVGGVDAAVTPMGISGFCRCKALATKFNDTPHKGSRPWDKNRSGFVMGEGSAILVLESEEFAKKRGAKNVFAELVGVGSTADAYHITSLDPEGQHVEKCMRLAIANGIAVTRDRELIEKLGYINAHATSTPVGDKTEIKAILGMLEKEYGVLNYKTDSGDAGSEMVVKDMLERNVRISSTKSSIGHLLGGSGAIEAALSVLALHNGIAPPTKNLDNPDNVPDYVNLVPYNAQPLADTCEYALSNSFGFGGTNASLLFRKRNAL